MSNPFATFRKNQKYWMAATVLLAILAFVVAPAIETATQAFRSGGADDMVVVRWDGGRITAADLNAATTKHGSLVRFLGALAKRVMENGGRPRVPGFQVSPQTGQILGLGIQTSSNDVDVCRSRILASHAKEMGVEFNDDSADAFLLEFCDDRISNEEFNEIFTDATNGQLSQFEMRELLKEELAAVIVSQVGRIGVFTRSPGAMWTDFQKLNRTAKVEAFPIFVDDYVGKVDASPTEAEIQAIYDDGTTRAFNPNSPEPGFIRRYHANVEYVQSNLQAYIQSFRDKVTEEEIKAEYDRREPAAGATGTDATSDQLETEPATTETATTASEDEPSESTPTESANQSSTAEPATETPESTTETPEASDQSSMAEGSKVRLVAFQQDGPPPVVNPPALQPDAPAVSVTGEADAAPGETAPEQEGSTEASLAEIAKEEGDVAVAEPSPEKPSPEMRTQTLEEARETIIDDLARDKAIPALDDSLTKLIQAEMNPYYQAYRQYTALKRAGMEDEDTKLPTKPDLKAYAQANNLTYGETGLADAVQLASTPFGLSNIRTDQNNQLAGMTANVAGSPGLELFQPMQSSYFDQAALLEGRAPEFFQYIFWKTEDRPAYIPELAEVREEVVDYWKRVKARDLADNAAKALASKVTGTSSAAWESALSTTELALVDNTDPFTWMTRFQDRVMTSNVAKLDSVGEEFMKAVFETPVNGVGVAANESKNTYYVFRVVEFGPDESDLQVRFNADPMKSGPMAIAAVESDELFLSWYRNLEEELDVQWQLPLDQ